jgi:hypothetical protein
MTFPLWQCVFILKRAICSSVTVRLANRALCSDSRLIGVFSHLLLSVRFTALGGLSPQHHCPQFLPLKSLDIKRHGSRACYCLWFPIAFYTLWNTIQCFVTHERWLFGASLMSLLGSSPGEPRESLRECACVP